MDPNLATPGSFGAFQTTHWTVVLEAARPDSPEGHAAFAQLYMDYWQPLYAYIRRRGFPPQEAEDITQDFFTRLLEKQAFANLRREGGRFRSFLLRTVSNFLANQWDHARAQKRGGGHQALSLDVADEEGRYLALEAPEHSTPESLFEQRWVLALLNHVSQRMRQEHAGLEKDTIFQDLEPHLQGDRSGLPYAQIALKHGVTEASIKVRVHRLRQRYAARLREEIARTVSSPEEVDEELRHLIQVMSG